MSVQCIRSQIYTFHRIQPIVHKLYHCQIKSKSTIFPSTGPLLDCMCPISPVVGCRIVVVNNLLAIFVCVLSMIPFNVIFEFGFWVFSTSSRSRAVSGSMSIVPVVVKYRRYQREDVRLGTGFRRNVKDTMTDLAGLDTRFFGSWVQRSTRDRLEGT